MEITHTEMMDALVQNYQFKKQKGGKLPTIDYVYPEYTADGLTEQFRFCPNLRNDLAQGASSIKRSLDDKSVIYTFEQSLIASIHPIAPRLKVASTSAIYPYKPLLFVGANESEVTAYVVKPVIDARMAWFTFTQDELTAVHETLQQNAINKPYKSLLQKVFRR